MKKYKLKQWVQDVIVIIGIAAFFIAGGLFVSYSNKNYDNKKTEMSSTQISQNEFINN